jgi:hypothetical protein
MNSKILKIIIATLALVFTAVVAPPVQALPSGGATMTNVCHWDSKTSSWRLLSLPQATLAGHFAHGDVLPNQPVPNQFGYTFNASCVPVQDPPLAVTVTEEDRADGWVTLSIAANRGAWAIKGLTCRTASPFGFGNSSWLYSEYSVASCGALQQTGGTSSSTTFTTKLPEVPSSEWQFHGKVELLDGSTAAAFATVWPPLTVRTHVEPTTYEQSVTETVTYTVGRDVTEIAAMECSVLGPWGDFSISVACGSLVESTSTWTVYSFTGPYTMVGDYVFTVSVTFTDGTSVTKQGGFTVYGGPATHVSAVLDESSRSYTSGECVDYQTCSTAAPQSQPFLVRAYDRNGQPATDMISVNLSTRNSYLGVEQLPFEGTTTISVPYDADHHDYYLKVTNADDSSMTTEYSLDVSSTFRYTLDVISWTSDEATFDMIGYLSTGRRARFRVTTTAPLFYDSSSGLLVQSGSNSNPPLWVSGEIDLGGAVPVNDGSGIYVDFDTAAVTFDEVEITNPNDPAENILVSLQADIEYLQLLCWYDGDECVEGDPPAN